MHRHTRERNECNQPNGTLVSDNPTMLNTSHGNAKEQNRTALGLLRAPFFVLPQTHTQNLRPRPRAWLRTAAVERTSALAALASHALATLASHALATLANAMRSLRSRMLVTGGNCERHRSGALWGQTLREPPKLRPRSVLRHTNVCGKVTRLRDARTQRLGSGVSSPLASAKKTHTPPRSGPIGASGKRLIPRRY